MNFNFLNHGKRVDNHEKYVCRDINSHCIGSDCPMVDRSDLSYDGFYCELQGIYFEV